MEFWGFSPINTHYFLQCKVVEGQLRTFGLLKKYITKKEGINEDGLTSLETKIAIISTKQELFG